MRCLLFPCQSVLRYARQGFRPRDRSLIYRCPDALKKIPREAGLNTPEPEISEDIQEIEFDEMWHFVKKDNKLWVIKAFDRRSRRTVGWVLGDRDSATFRRLYNKVKHLKDTVFYTADEGRVEE